MEVQNEKIIETTIGVLSWEDQQFGIVCGKTKPDVEITIDLLKIDFQMYEEHFPHPHRKLLFDMSDLSGANKEIRDFFTGPEGIYNHFDAIAVFTNSRYSIAGIIAAVAIKVYYLRKPTRLFHHRQEALDWLKTII